MKIPAYLFLFFLLLSASCRQQDYPRLLAVADSLMDTRPDSAWQVLRGISPEALPTEGERMRHRLLTVEAECRNGIFTTDDSLVIAITDYFQKQGDMAMLIKAYYCSGMLYGGKRQYDVALATYNKGAKLAQQTERWNLLGHIAANMGNIYQINDLNYQADSLYRQAENMARQTDDTILLAETLYRRGICQLRLKKNNHSKAEQLMQEAYCLAVGNQRGSIALSMSHLYSRWGVLDKALDYGRKAVMLMQQDTLRLYRACVILGDAYYKMAQYDSAQYFFLQSLASEALDIKANAYMRLADIARNKQDWKKVSEYKEKEFVYRDSLRQQNQKVAIILQQSRSEINKERELTRRSQVVSISLLMIVILTVIGLIFYLRKRRLDNRKPDTELRNHEQLLYQNEESKEEVNGSQKKGWKKEDFRYFQIKIRKTESFRKIERLVSYHEEHPHKANIEHFEEKDKEAFMAETENLLPDYISRLVSLYPDLDNDDIFLLCLCLADLPVSHIAVVLERHRDSIYKRLRKIKKEKLNVVIDSDLKDILHLVES